MSKQSIILSAAGLKNVVINKEEKEEEFIFKIGKKEMKMNKIFAEFISPRVSHIHQCDPTINFINLTDLNNNNNHSNKVNEILEELFSENNQTRIKKLSEGNSIEIENEEIIKCIGYFSILVNNEELFQKIEEIKRTNKKDEINNNELLEEIEFLYEMNPTFNSYQYSKLIDDVSTKITTDNIKDLQKIPKQILYLILHNEHFQIESMDSLFDFIDEIFSNENEEDNKEEEYDITRFYEIIDMNELSKTKFEKFLSKLDYRELTTNLWNQLCEILVNNKEYTKKETKEMNKKQNKKEYQQIEFDGQANHRFNGIIHHLQGTEKTNICDRGIINVTSSSCYSNYLPKHAVDFDNNNYFFSSSSNAWLKYDFKEKKIRPTHYSIKTRNDQDRQNPVHWVIEVSNTDKEDDWRIIDSRTGVTSVSKRNQSDTFDISTQLSDNEYYRYIRFRCNGKTSEYCSCLAISSLEYFGYLI